MTMGYGSGAGGAGGNPYAALVLEIAGGFQTVRGMIRGWQTLVGGHPAGSGTSAARAAAALAWRQLRLGQQQFQAAQRVQVAAVNVPGSALNLTYTTTPESAPIEAKISNVEAKLATATSSPKIGHGARQQAKLAKLQKKLRKLEAKRTLTAAPVYFATYGVNNPLIPGSREDPRGAIRPIVHFLT